MIKYADIPGYANCGEVIPFSHVYQFKQAFFASPMVIVLHAYEGKAKAFKGYLFHAERTFESIPLTAKERTALEPYVGEIEQCDLDVVVAGTELEWEIIGYRKVERKTEGQTDETI